MTFVQADHTFYNVVHRTVFVCHPMSEWRLFGAASGRCSTVLVPRAIILAPVPALLLYGGERNVEHD